MSAATVSDRAAKKIGPAPEASLTIPPMKRLSLLAVVATAFVGISSVSPKAQATEVGNGRNIGLGFAVGTPTSIVGKLFLNRTNAVDVGLAFWDSYDGCYYRDRGVCRDGDDGRSGVDHISVNADYLWQETLARGTAQLDWHIGPGGRLSVSDYYDNNLWLAARMPVGLDLTFARPSFLETFVELAPRLVIIPVVRFQVEAFIGVRFYF
jgi:hypothetical protein